VEKEEKIKRNETCGTCRGSGAAAGSDSATAAAGGGTVNVGDKEPTDTGVAGIATVGALAVVSAVMVVVSRKKK
jgi:DnaJ-class molecular chaperone